RLLECRHQRARPLLARLDIRLVERIDPDDGARGSYRKLEAEELLRDVVWRLQHDAHNRMSGLLQCVQRARVVGIGLVCGPQIDEEPVIAINAGRADWLPIDGDQALAVLPG